MAGEFRSTNYHLVLFECNSIHSLPKTPSARQGTIFGIDSFSQKSFIVRSSLNYNSDWSKRLTRIRFNFMDNSLAYLFNC